MIQTAVFERVTQSDRRDETESDNISLAGEYWEVSMPGESMVAAMLDEDPGNVLVTKVT